MNSIDEEKYSKVISWLESQYESKENIPKFEVTPHTIQILFEIAVKNEKRNKQAELIKQDWEQKTEYYRNEGKELTAKIIFESNVV